MQSVFYEAEDGVWETEWARMNEDKVMLCIQELVRCCQRQGNKFSRLRKWHSSDDWISESQLPEACQKPSSWYFIAVMLDHTYSCPKSYCLYPAYYLFVLFIKTNLLHFVLVLFLFRNCRWAREPLMFFLLDMMPALQALYQWATSQDLSKKKILCKHTKWCFSVIFT